MKTEWTRFPLWEMSMRTARRRNGAETDRITVVFALEYFRVKTKTRSSRSTCLSESGGFSYLNFYFSYFLSKCWKSYFRFTLFEWWPSKLRHYRIRIHVIRLFVCDMSVRTCVCVYIILLCIVYIHCMSLENEHRPSSEYFRISRDHVRPLFS